jgi:predicted transcriptional regulator
LTVLLPGDTLTAMELDEAAKLEIPGSTLTHHIAHLKSAGVIRQQRQQATLICTMEYDLLRELVDYLTEECCVDEATRNNAA